MRSYIIFFVDFQTNEKLKINRNEFRTLQWRLQSHELHAHRRPGQRRRRRQLQSASSVPPRFRSLKLNLQSVKVG
jgi:hypothetical protein